MDDLLTPAKANNEHEKADALLSTNAPKQRAERERLAISSPEDVLAALKSNLDLNLLIRALRWLAKQNDDFSIKQPGPKASEIIFTLVNSTAPDYWQVLSEEETSDHVKGKYLFVSCLSSVAGLGAIVARLRSLSSQLQDPQGPAKIPAAGIIQLMDDMLALLEHILCHDGFIASVWRDVTSSIARTSLKSLQWREFLSLVASGKLLSVASEAVHASKDRLNAVQNDKWIGDGRRYAAWLGENIKDMNVDISDDDHDGRAAVSQLLGKAMTLGYKGQHMNRLLRHIKLKCWPRSNHWSCLLRSCKWEQGFSTETSSLSG